MRCNNVNINNVSLINIHIISQSLHCCPSFLGTFVALLMTRMTHLYILGGRWKNVPWLWHAETGRHVPGSWLVYSGVVFMAGRLLWRLGLSSTSILSSSESMRSTVYVCVEFLSACWTKRSGRTNCPTPFRTLFAVAVSRFRLDVNKPRTCFTCEAVSIHIDDFDGIHVNDFDGICVNDRSGEAFGYRSCREFRVSDLVRDLNHVGTYEL